MPFRRCVIKYFKQIHEWKNMNSSLLTECTFVYFALLPNISVIFSLAFFGTVYEEHLHVADNFDKYIGKVFLQCCYARLHTSRPGNSKWSANNTNMVVCNFETSFHIIFSAMNLNQCDSSSWSHLEVILTFPLLCKEVSERITVCYNGRISSSCKAFQLVLTWNELFGWRTMETVPSYFICSPRVLKIANTIWKCACILLCNCTQVP